MPEYISPPRNMVQDVKNIIDAYKMGPLRALAQDPVPKTPSMQNAPERPSPFALIIVSAGEQALTGRPSICSQSPIPTRLACADRHCP